jgi:hypothetical protein
MGDFHRHWRGEAVRPFDLREAWTVACGQGRYDPDRGNAAYAKRSGVALNFRIRGQGETVTEFEFCAAWPDSGWQLMFHHDPERAAWPRHPERHLQLGWPTAAVGAAPFRDWRLPLGEHDPLRLLEYLVEHVR